MSEANPYQPPSSDPSFEAASTTSKEQLKKTPVLLVILLVIITLGFYTPYWYTSRRKIFNRLAESNKIPLGLCIALFLLTPFANAGTIEQDGSSLVFFYWAISVVWVIVTLVLRYKVQGILEANYEDDFSGLLNFFFSILYLQFKINRLGEARADALQGSSFTGLGLR